MKNVIICADHAIGYKVVKYIVNHKSKYFKILSIYTTKTNDNGFWKPIKNVPNLNIQVKYFNDNKKFSNELKEKNVDYIFLISWKHLLSQEVISSVNIGIVNLHYSLLPKYKGIYPVNNAIINGENETGITYHWIDDNIDAGVNIFQKSLKIEIDDTASTLIRKLDKLAFISFKKIWLNKKNFNKDKNSLKDNVNSYFSKKDFEITNELILSDRYTVEKLLDLFRGKTFKGKSSLYFRDKNNKKIFISVNLKREKE